MILRHPEVQIEHITPDALQLIEAAGRTCYKSEARITEESARPFVKMLIDRGHEAMLEHAHMTVRFICDRGVSHELVRHRIASFAQESTRYCNYGRGEGHVTFIITPWWDVEPGEGAEEQDFKINPPSNGTRVWLRAMLSAEQDYLAMLRGGLKPEQARAVLPNSLKTEVVVTANFREWRHFFKLRCAPAAHPQMRQVAQLLHVAARLCVPEVFEGLL